MMKRLSTGALSLSAAALLAFAVSAQPPGGPQNMQRGRGGGAGRGGPQGQQSGYQPSMNLLIIALNTNGDSEISADEIKKAAVSLKKLDRNRDGKLTIDEVMPSGPPAFGGPGQGGSARPQHGGFEQGGPPSGRGRGGFGGPGHGGPGEGGPGHGGPGGPGGPGALVEQLMSLDADKDGKVTKEELSEGMESVFEKGDLDKDGAIDREEAEKLLEELDPHHGGPGGGRGGASGGRPATEGRPQRPQ